MSKSVALRPLEKFDPRKINEWKPKKIEDLAAYWFIFYAQGRKTPSSLARDRSLLTKYIVPVFGAWELADLSARAFEQWFLTLPQTAGVSLKTANHVLTLFRKILNDAVRWGFVDKNPLFYVKKYSEGEIDIQFWNKDEIRMFLGFWGTQENIPKFFWPAMLALYTGMRKGELMGLKWECVDFANGLITVKRTFCKVQKKLREQTKSKKIRRIPISTALAAHLKKLHEITGKSGLVLPPFHADSYCKQLERMANRCGVKKIRFHDLRHSFASNYLMEGGNIYDLQKILGHSTIQVTERYSHLIPAQLRGKTEILGF